MAEDPELKDDIIEPLKLQGVADIDDTATIMRFKITVHPTRPSFLQREAVKRLIAAFKEAGIEFASANAVLAALPPSDRGLRRFPRRRRASPAGGEYPFRGSLRCARSGLPADGRRRPRSGRPRG